MKELYGITEKDIKETRHWEEGRATIDIEKETFNFNVVQECTLQELEEYEIEKEKIKETNINLENIPFEDVFDLKAFIDKANYNKQYYFYNKLDEKYFSLIQ